DGHLADRGGRDRSRGAACRRGGSDLGLRRGRWAAAERDARRSSDWSRRSSDWWRWQVETPRARRPQDEQWTPAASGVEAAPTKEDNPRRLSRRCRTLRPDTMSPASFYGGATEKRTRLTGWSRSSTPICGTWREPGCVRRQTDTRCKRPPSAMRFFCDWSSPSG